MIPKSGLWRLVAAALVSTALAGTASAQITTGTVSGTVKDAQGGVIPGATVVLVSETKGTKSAPVVSNETGDYVFPNVTPDTYTVEVTMEGVQDAAADRRAGQRRRPRRAGRPRPSRSAAPTETVNVTADAPLVQSQSGERSFAVTTSQVENLPVAHANFTSLASLAPGVVQNGASPAARGWAARARTTS